MKYEKMVDFNKKTVRLGNTEYRRSRKLATLALVLVAIIGFWSLLGESQQRCLISNDNNITLCE